MNNSSNQFTSYLGSASNLADSVLRLCAGPSTSGAYGLGADYAPNFSVQFEVQVPDWSLNDFKFSIVNDVQTFAYKFPSRSNLSIVDSNGSPLQSWALSNPLSNAAYNSFRLVSQSSNLVAAVNGWAYVGTVPNWSTVSNNWNNGTFVWSASNSASVSGSNLIRSLFAQSTTTFDDPCDFRYPVTARVINSEKLGAFSLKSANLFSCNISTSNLLSFNLSASNIAASKVSATSLQSSNSTFSNLTVTGPLSMNGRVANQIVSLWGNTDDPASTAYYGFGLNSGVLRYQVDASVSSHVFYAGSSEVARISGTGETRTKSVVCSNIAASNLGACAFCNVIPISMMSGGTLSNLTVNSNLTLNSGILSTGNQVNNNVIALYGGDNSTSSTGHYGFGVNPYALRYNVPGGSSHVFFADTIEMARLQNGMLSVASNLTASNVSIGNIGFGSNWAGFAHSNRSSQSNYALMHSGSTGDLFLNYGTGSTFQIRQNNSLPPKFHINSSGSIGIATQSPTSTLSVQGSFDASSGSFSGQLDVKNVGVLTNSYIEFGKNIAGKEMNAGRMGYQLFSSGLDVVGAGSTSRWITLYDNVTVTASLYTPVLQVGSSGTVAKTVLYDRVFIGTSPSSQTKQVTVAYGLGGSGVAYIVTACAEIDSTVVHDFSVTINGKTTAGTTNYFNVNVRRLDNTYWLGNAYVNLCITAL